jgi:ADP-heptose:LPS heptosyltransferase
MNILLISSLSKGYEKLILINLIKQNLIFFYKDQNLKFDLIKNESFVSENIFFKKSDFNKIKMSFGLKDLWNKRTDPYDLIINLDTSFRSVLYSQFISKKKRIGIDKKDLRKYANLSATDFEIVLAENILTKILKDINGLMIKPELNIDKTKLINTERLINWTLESNGQKQLDFLEYIFVYLDVSEELFFLDNIMNLLKRIMMNREGNKLILIINGSSEYDDLTSKIKNLFSEVSEQILNLDFISFDDFYYLLKFSEKSILTITNDSYLDKVNRVEDKICLFLKKKKLNDASVEHIIEQLKYYLRTVINPQ